MSDVVFVSETKRSEPREGADPSKDTGELATSLERPHCSLHSHSSSSTGSLGLTEPSPSPEPKLGRLGLPDKDQR